MRMVKCYDCGRRYDYDEDGFCPKCGGFNQPVSASRIGADGSVVRAEGINERNHAGSFVHKEYHAEERKRRASGLDKGVDRIPKTSKISRAAKPAAALAKSGKQGKKGAEGAIIAAVIWILFVFFQIIFG